MEKTLLLINVERLEGDTWVNHFPIRFQTKHHVFRQDIVVKVASYRSYTLIGHGIRQNHVEESFVSSRSFSHHGDLCC